MSHTAPVSRQTWHLTLLVAFSVSTFIACGQQEGDGSLKSTDIQSVKLALSPTSSPYGSAFFSTTGVNCYQNGSDYMCAVDLRHAHVRTAHGSIYPGSESFYRNSVWNYWSSVSSPDPVWGRKVVAVNTSFFNTGTNPAEISFPLKTDESSTPLTNGKDCDAVRNYSLYRKLLHVWNDRGYADIGDYLCTSASDKAALSSYGSAPNIIGGLDVSYPKGGTDNRTFFGVLDTNGDFQYETLLIYSTKGNVTQTYAASQLSAFGEGKTVKIMMFDGSGSSQMVVDGSLVVPSKDGRGVTTALIVYAP